MKKFIAREKLSRQARKKLDSTKRVCWEISPITRKVASKKLYNRKRKSDDLND